MALSLRPRRTAPRLSYRGGHQVALLRGGDELFPRMAQAVQAARRDVWFATYIFNADPTGERVAQMLADAARRGVAVHVLVDGFGSKATLGQVRQWLDGSGAQLEIFRAIDRWWAWFQPGQLRRLHQKLVAVDGEVAYVGGINVIDDRFDLSHGWGDAPRLDFAVELRGAVAADVQRVVQALWLRAHLGRDWRQELRRLAASGHPIKGTVALLREMRTQDGHAAAPADAAPPPVVAALVVRDNLLQRRAIERAYIEAIVRAQARIDIACPYFYPGRSFRRALARAARRGVRIRLLMQGKVDYRFAALAARVLYADLLARGVRVFEYTPAFLHAKVAVVDDEWATVGSSNIDPLSLLVNLEANAIVTDAAFVAELARQLDDAFAASTEIVAAPVQPGARGWLQRALVAWAANTYLRIAGITGRY